MSEGFEWLSEGIEILRSEVNSLRSQKSKLGILWSGITKIDVLTSDTAGIIDPAGQNTYSNISKVTNKSNTSFYSVIIYIYHVARTLRGTLLFLSEAISSM